MKKNKTYTSNLFIVQRVLTGSTLQTWKLLFVTVVTFCSFGVCFLQEMLDCQGAQEILGSKERTDYRVWMVCQDARENQGPQVDQGYLVCLERREIGASQGQMDCQVRSDFLS